MSDFRAKRTVTSLNKLRNMGPTSNSSTKFILDSHPFDDNDEDNLPSPKEEWIITGRLLPNSPIYRNGAVKVEIIIGTTFPIDPPKVCVKTSVFHPNISKEGLVCIDLLSKDGTWTPVTTLEAIVTEVTRVIDEPSIDRIQYTDAATLYDTNRKEYERIATETFNKNSAPRN